MSRTRSLVPAIPFIGLTGFTSAQSEHSHTSIMEEVVVSAPFQRSVAETALPISILTGEELQEQGSSTLGETLQDTPGMANASFGTGVGQPVIRGQTGGRVKILQNSVGVTDASSISPDHANGVDTLLADRLEVIRGPSTLLYGSGAVGGVVNVIDNRIPENVVDGPELLIEHRHDSVSDGNTSLLKLDFGNAGWAMHIEGLVRDTNAFEIPGYSIDIAGLEATEELHGHDDGELTNTRGFIGNSETESDAWSVGFSRVGERGFIGFSVSQTENNYGLPPGVHSHGEEEDEHHDEDEHEDVEFVRIDMERTRHELKGEYRFYAGMLRKIRGSVAFTDYEHSEIEIFQDGASETGTTFSNEGLEGRFIAELSNIGDWSTVIGLQLADTEFSAMGEEAFIPQADISSVGVFALAHYTADRFSTELGLRSERNKVELAGNCDSSESSFSASAGVLYELNSSTNLIGGLSRSERTPGVEELYSNVSHTTCTSLDEDDWIFHAATNLFEVGNPDLGTETSTNLELGLRRHAGNITSEVSVFYNRVDDYIGLQLTPGDSADEVARYISSDAIFSGVEAQMDIHVWERDWSEFSVSFFADQVRARFDRGGNLPRVTPSKLGLALNLSGSQWSGHLRYTRVQTQDRTSDLETETNGYRRVSLYADRHWSWGKSRVTGFVRVSNMLDEEIRNHASLLKNFAPEPGRNVQVGIRLNY